ncbi:MAG: VWA domain-containing protein [Bacteroidia bacterium]|nr:VWA domain-containing protein [Bacteroidia bacterium]
MNKIVNIKAGLDRGAYSKKEGSNYVYLYVELKGEKLESKKERIPLNLGLVIDRSGSMTGDKIKFAKEALKFVIKNLGPQDKMAIVKYDSSVETLVASTSVKNKSFLLDQVDKIRPGGATNLSGGMLEGIHQVGTSFQKEGTVNRVFLLSDGLANHGITQHDKILELARTAFRKNRISVSSFGLGADFNEKLMIDLAEHGGGNQYFIGLPEDIPSIFAQELEGLLDVVAQNASFSIEFPRSYLSLEKSFGMKLQSRGQHVDGRLGDIFSDDSKAFLLKFKVEKPIDEDLNFKLKFTYDDVVVNMGRIEQAEELRLRISEDKNTLSDSANKAVLEQVAIFESNSRHKELLESLRMGKYDLVKQGTKDLISYIEAQLLHFPNSEELKAQLDTTKELLNEIDEYKEQSKFEQELSLKHYSSRSSYVEKKKMSMYRSRNVMRSKEKGNKS